MPASGRSAKLTVLGAIVPPRFADTSACGRGESDAHILGVPLKNNGVPENRNARSGVRFLGIRSNKCTRAWRQAMRTACRPSPCCDEQRGESRSGFPKIAKIRRQQLAENFASNYLARLKTTFFKKRTQFVAYLRLERVNLRGINLRERAKKPRKEGRALRSRFSAATLLRGKRE